MNDGLMKLYRTILPVGNIDEAEKFYSKIFSLKGERVSPGRHYFNLGGTILACYDPKTDGDDEDPQWHPHENQYIYIAVAELEKIFEAVTKSKPLRVDKSIETMPWGERLFYMNDPWGNPMCFVDERTVFLGGERG